MKKWLVKKEVRKKVIRNQHKLNLDGMILIQNSRAKTINHIVGLVEQCVDWQDKHPDCCLSSAELGSNVSLPDAGYLARAFGSMPKFLDFFYDEAQAS